MQKSILDIKDTLQLNSYEAQVYVSLLEKGIASASELAENSKVPRSRCYDVLESLEKKGFVFMKIGKPIKYIAIAPQEAIHSITKEVNKEKNRLLAFYDTAKETDAFKELQSLYATGIQYIDNAEITTSISGKTAINAFLKEMFSNAQKNISVHSTEKEIERKLKIIRKVGTKVPVQVHTPEPIKTSADHITSKVAKHGMKVVQVDEDQLLFFSSVQGKSPEGESAIWIKSKFAADAVKEFLQ